MKQFDFDRVMEQYLAGEITISEFVKLFPEKTFSYTDKIIDLLERAYIEKNSDDVEFLTIVALVDGAPGLLRE